MATSIEAIYERGALRPLEPLALPEGTHLKLVIISRDEQPHSPAQILAAIASLPEEGTSDTITGREHDATLYQNK